MEFINWLISLLTKKNVGTHDVIIENPLPQSDAQMLRLLAHSIELDLQPIECLIKHRDAYRPESKPRYWAVADFSKHSSKKRLHVFDVVDKAVKSYYVAHGQGSDPKFNGWCEITSNTPNSKCSSLGIYRASETYISKSFGYACRLDGLEPTNSKARERAIVFHGAKYAEDAYIKKNGKTGRSWGCLAVGFQYSKDLIDKLKGGSLICVWK